MQCTYHGLKTIDANAGSSSQIGVSTAPSPAIQAQDMIANQLANGATTLVVNNNGNSEANTNVNSVNNNAGVTSVDMDGVIQSPLNVGTPISSSALQSAADSQRPIETSTCALTLQKLSNILASKSLLATHCMACKDNETTNKSIREEEGWLKLKVRLVQFLITLFLLLL